MSPAPLPRVDAPGAPRPPRPVRLCALDLDGTLLDGEQRLHPRSAAAVAAVGRGGVAVALATGRMYRSALPWAQRLGVGAPLICYQGALVRAIPDGNAPALDGVPQGDLLIDEPLAAVAARRVLEVARSGGWHVQAYHDDRLLCEQERPEAELYAGIAQVGYTLVDDLGPEIERGSTKMVCVVLEEAQARRCEATLRAVLRGSARVVRSLPEFVEVTSRRATKGQALRGVCAWLGVGLDEVVAVGDAPNDADMLAAAGFAVAVAGAPEALLRHADCLCPGAAEGGVGVALEALGLTG